MKIIDLDYLIFRTIRRFKGQLVSARQRGVLSNWNIFRAVSSLFIFVGVVTYQPDIDRSRLTPPAPAPVANVAKQEPLVLHLSPSEPSTPIGFGSLLDKQVLGASQLTTFPHPRLDSNQPPLLTAQAGLVIHPPSGVVLYGENTTLALPPASLTKMMTALLSLETYSLQDVVVVPPECLGLLGNQMGLYVYEKITVENLLRGMLLNSASDAACTLASYKQSLEVFVTQMNARASQLGMHNTWFSNPIGLDENGVPHHSTARDLMTLVQEVMRQPDFRRLVTISQTTVFSVDNEFVHYLENTNELLTTFPGTTGIKTGRTSQAGECLALSFEQDGHEIFAVILGSEGRFSEMKKLVEWVYASYNWE